MDNINTAIARNREAIDVLRTLAANEQDRALRLELWAQVDKLSEIGNALAKMPVLSGIKTVDVAETFSSGLFGSQE